MKTNSKNPIIILVAIAILLFVLYESRFFLFGPFGEPQMQSMPNCGETRDNFDVKINSKAEFLQWVKTETSKYPPEGFSKWLKDGKPSDKYFPSLLHPAAALGEFSRGAFDEKDIVVKDNGSLIFNQKIYSVKPVPYCQNFDYEITQNGNARSKGCCGI